MKYRRLGKTNLKVSVVGIGTWQYGGGGVLPLGHLLGGPRCIQGGDAPPGPVFIQELLALHQPLLMGVDRQNVLQPCPRLGHQAVLHLHLPLPHDVVGAFRQQVVDLADGAGGAVLNGEDGVVRLPPPQGQEHIPEPGQAPAVHLSAEIADASLLAVGSRLPLVDHPGS